MKIEVPEELFAVKKWECEVVSNHNQATFIKELILKLPKGEKVDLPCPVVTFQLECPGVRNRSRNLRSEKKFREDVGQARYLALPRPSTKKNNVIRA